MSDEFVKGETLHFGEINGILSLDIEGGTRYPWVEVYATRPLTNPYEMLSIRDRLDPDLKEIGLLRSLAELRAPARAVVKKAIDERYFAPRILKVLDVTDSYATLVWRVVTDHGPTEILLKDPHQNIRPIGPDAFVLEDIDECRYRIDDVKGLDKKSQKLFEKYYYQ